MQRAVVVTSVVRVPVLVRVRVRVTLQYIVEQISGDIFQGGGLRSTTFVSIYQNVRIGLYFKNPAFATLANLA